MFDDQFYGLLFQQNLLTFKGIDLFQRRVMVVCVKPCREVSSTVKFTVYSWVIIVKRVQCKTSKQQFTLAAKRVDDQIIKSHVC